MKKLIRFIIAVILIIPILVAMIFTAAYEWLIDDGFDYWNEHWSNHIIINWILWRDTH